jgi:hypothetical protein
MPKAKILSQREKHQEEANEILAKYEKMISFQGHKHDGDGTFNANSASEYLKSIIKDS